MSTPPPHTDRDNRREVGPPVKIANQAIINDSKYPVPGWGSQWTLTKDEGQAYLRDASMIGNDHVHHCKVGDLKPEEARPM